MTTNNKKKFMGWIFSIFAAAVFTVSVTAQVTTSDIVGVVSDPNGAVVSGATITAVHTPSGSKYSTTTNGEGRFTLPGLRVGGPYTITVSQGGFKDQKANDVFTSLGNTSTINFTMNVADANVEVTVTSDDTFSEVKTGSSTNLSLNEIGSIPTGGRRVNDFAKLSPFYGGGPFGGSIAGQDNRMNNITVDGSYFNNSFGLGGQPGERTNVSPIPLDAIEEFQINVAPYDVRQGNFVGAGINTITKSGTNSYHGSGYYNFRNETFLGKEAGPNLFNRGQLDYKLYGLTFGGALPFFNFGENNGPLFTTGRDKSFFFFSYENEKTSRPAHTFTACPVAFNTPGSGCGTGSVSRVSKLDLDDLSSFLRTNFGYDPGAYQNYNFLIPATKYLFRTDFNLNSSNRLTLRYMTLSSLTDQNISTSNSGNTAGFGRGSQGTNYLSFQNSNYQIKEDIRSVVGEWTSSFGSRASNSLIVGYTFQDESRPNVTKLFPLVDIHDGTTGTLSATTTLTSFGYEPFTPLNTLKYKSFQVQDNFSLYRGSHTIQAGLSFEKYHSLNIFYPSSQSIYSYRSVADFKADALAYLNGTTSTVTVPRFNVRYINQPGLTSPDQLLDVIYLGAYGQDQWKVKDNFTLTYGLRMEVPFFGNTGFKNSLVDTLSFTDGKGGTLKLATDKLPNSNILWSPRVGFNWSPLQSQKLQLRGGSGVFTARPPYVWISNQIGNNGVLTSLNTVNGTTAANSTHFNPNPNAYKPTNVTGAPVAGAQDLNFAVPDYKFPQIWRSSVAVDYKLPLGLVAGSEYLYTKDVKGTAYINANLSNPDGAFTGPDTRPRWITDTCTSTTAFDAKVNCSVLNAITLTNSSAGKAWNLAFTLEKRNAKGFWAKGGYSYGESKNLVDASSTAGTSYANIFSSKTPNNPELSFSSSTMGHRVYASASYTVNYFKFGSTTVSSFWESKTQSTGSYRYSNDMNNDTTSGNDMIYIQKDPSETIFVANGTITAQQQSDAWEAFIRQDKYLSSHRGQYALRGAAFFPLVHTLDLGFIQAIKFRFLGADHRLQVRADIVNFGNMLNHNWGVGKTPASNNFQPLAYVAADASGRPTFRLNSFGGALINRTFDPRNSSADVYQMTLGIKYSF
ncbi:MAG: carboxypeptidase-like regulatory domain-containing protein [Pyrinomonadaceae bacterium]